MLIEFEHAAFSFGRSPVLQDITLALEPGSFHFLIGRSGSGKTTLLRLCYLDLAPSSGAVRLFGRAIAGNNRNEIADLRRAVGVVHQERRFLDHLPVFDNVALPLQIAGADAEARVEDLCALLDWVGLGRRADALPAELDGDERQRAALARALILSPEILLADEPSIHVEEDAALHFLSLLIELNRMGKTVLVATRDPALVEAAMPHVPAGVLSLEAGRLDRLGAAA